jgi:predicted chitinase
VALPEDGCLTAAWFWHTHKAADGTSLDALADAWQIDAITRVVNGPGMAEAALRRQRSQEVSNALTLLLSQPL